MVGGEGYEGRSRGAREPAQIDAMPQDITATAGADVRGTHGAD